MGWDEMRWMKGFEREGGEDDLEIPKTAGNCACVCMYGVG